MSRKYYVYMMTNRYNAFLYTGVTRDLEGRVFQHKQGTAKSFTRRYNVHKVVYFEVFEDVRHAIEREKQIKAGSRRRKIRLIESMNPDWRDLSERFEIE